MININIGFTVGYFFCDIKANIVWEAFKRYWLDIYLGLLDVVSVNVGTNFAVTKF